MEGIRDIVSIRQAAEDIIRTLAKYEILHGETEQVFAFVKEGLNMSVIDARVVPGTQDLHK